MHACEVVNAKGVVQYVKFRWKSQQGIANLSATEASALQAKDFSHATKDLYGYIGQGKFPSWELVALVMPESKLTAHAFNPLDATKDWQCDTAHVTCTTLGKMTPNKRPENFFRFTEQVAFSPAVLVPGIEPSEDRLLQGRLSSYSDTQGYRLGVNHQHLPVNRAKSPIRTYAQDGAGATQPALAANINYQPNQFDGSLTSNVVPDPAHLRRRRRPPPQLQPGGEGLRRLAAHAEHPAAQARRRAGRDAVRPQPQAGRADPRRHRAARSVSRGAQRP